MHIKQQHAKYFKTPCNTMLWEELGPIKWMGSIVPCSMPVLQNAANYMCMSPQTQQAKSCPYKPRIWAMGVSVSTTWLDKSPFRNWRRQVENCRPNINCISSDAVTVQKQKKTPKKHNTRYTQAVKIMHFLELCSSEHKIGTRRKNVHIASESWKS